MHKILFFSQDIAFQLEREDSVSNWILSFVRQEGYEIGYINYIFMSDEALLTLNRTVLNHDYYTDIITIPYSKAGSKKLIADIYISIDRIIDNANVFELEFSDELHRVLIHGIIHLMGFDDKSSEGAQEMRRIEDKALESWEGDVPRGT